MPFSAAQATKRETMSPPTGCDPTRKRPRSAIPSGVCTRALIARIRSHGVSALRRTVASKTPPPEISRHANPAWSRISATCRISAVGSAPASGSCERSRTVVATSFGTTRDLSDLPERTSRGFGCRRALRAGDVAAVARVDLDALAGVHEHRHLHDRAGLELRRLRHVRDRVPTHGRLRLGDRNLAGRRHLEPCRLAVDGQHLHRARGLEEEERLPDLAMRQPELLVRLLVHEVRFRAVVVEVLDVLHLGVHAGEALAGAERLVDD